MRERLAGVDILIHNVGGSVEKTGYEAAIVVFPHNERGNRHVADVALVPSTTAAQTGNLTEGDLRNLALERAGGAGRSAP